MKKLLNMLAISLFSFTSIYAIDVVLETKVMCATLPGEVVEFGGFNKIGPNGEIIPRGDTTKQGAFPVGNYKECYVFMQTIKDSKPEEIKEAAYEIAHAVNPAIVRPKK